MSHPWIARPNNAQRRTAQQRSVRLRQLRAAMLLAFSGAMLVPPRPVQADGQLPTGNVTAFGNATVTTATVNGASTMTVNQTSDKAIINWQSFNIDKGNTVNFQQPGATSVALNRIGGNAPSTIAGNLNANGQIYLINTNGILFATGATVNVNSLTASTLDISDQLFKDGILSASKPNGVSSQLTPVFTAQDSNGDIHIQSGAALNADAQGGGRIMIIAPNVDNQGVITAPDGQIILAAGAKVYLQSSTDPNLRGLLVEVDSGGSAQNLGQLLSQHGNITLVGMNVNQGGTAKATTSVSANGSIYLLAEDNAVKDATRSDTKTLAVTTTETGTVTLATGSVTEVTPDLGDTKTAVDEQAQAPSTVTVQGGSIHMASGSRITATSGQVTLSALADPSDPTVKHYGAAANGSHIVLDAGSMIDVSGGKVDLPMDSNLVKVDLYANELADSPLQRNGVLRGKTVTVDARVGTPLANVTGAIAAIGRTVAERTTTGGTVNLQSEGDVVINPSATIDVSGGWKQFQSGFLDTTQLVSQGVIFDIGSADPNRVYSGIAGNSQGRFIPSYVQGSDAGTVQVIAHSVTQDGSLLGAATAGIYQRGVRPVDPTLCDLGCQASTRPLGGELLLGNSKPLLSSGVADYSLGDVTLDSGFAALSDTGGFTRFSVYSNGEISVPADTVLNLGPGGSLNLTGKDINLSGTVTAAGGTVSLNTVFTATEQSGDDNDLVIGDTAGIDVRGMWANDLQQGTAPPTLGSTAINGGSVSLAAAGNISLGSDSLIDVSGGAWVNSAGKLTAGNGGNISLATSHELRGASLQESAMTLGGTLRGYAPGAGGSIRVTANSVRIGQSADPLPGSTLNLDPAFFQEGGFGNYMVTANVGGLTVASGSTLAPLARNLQLNNDFGLHTSGSDIYGFSHLVTLPNGQRKPVNITLQSNNSAAQTVSDQTGILTVGSGASIVGDTGASIALLADKRIDIEGVLAAAAGNITLRLTPPTNGSFDAGFDATQSIWLGAQSALSAAGTTVLTPNTLNLNWGQVLSGGTITLDAQRGYVVARQGARVDVSGTTGQLDLVQANGGYRRTTVASAGGNLNITTAEGLLWDGTTQAQSGAPSVVSGGSLNLTVTRANINIPTNGTPFPDADRRIVINNESNNVPQVLQAGDAVDSGLDGQARINSTLLGNSGFDNVTLASDQTIEFQADPALSLRGRLVLNAPQLSLADNVNVHLDADYLALGASENSVLLQQRSVLAPAAIGGTLFGHANSLLELIGDVSLNADAQLSSAGDLRLRGVLASNDSSALTGSLQTTGDVTLTADQVYASTFSDYTIDLLGSDTTLTVNPNPGHTPLPPLSAGSALTVNAPNIINNGVLEAPLGTITLNAGNNLVLAANSITSTSAQGQLIPFGMTQNGTDWVYDFGNNNVATLPAPPEKRINLQGANVNIAAGAIVNLSGGGDLYGYEFTPGPGGSKDVLSAANAPGSYAVLPSLGGAIAPYDTQYYQGSDLQPGDSVYLSGGGGLAAGIYTLLPARYALLPGAYLVTAVAGYQDLPPLGVQPALLNGSTVVAGYRTLGDTGLQADQRWNGFAVRSADASNPYGPRMYSEYTDSYASKFFTASAARLPQDAGNLAINTTNTLLLNGALQAAVAANGRGAQVDIVAPELSVVNSIDSAGSGVQLTATELNNLGAESLLLGATRHSADDGTLLDVGATDVSIGQDVHLSGPELLLAAQHKVTVASGAQLSANGKLANTAPDTLIFGRDGNGDGALLRLSVGPQAAIRREHSPGDTGILEVQADTLLSTAGSLALDATQSTESSGTLDVTGALSLGAARINLGAVDNSMSGLDLTNTQLADFTGLTELLLRSYSTVDMYGAATLGTPALGSLAIEAAGLRGFNNDAGTAMLAAGSITLSNPDQIAAPAAESGTGTLQLHAYNTAGHGGDINTGAGNFAIDGFGTVSLTADTQIAAHDTGTLNTSADVTLNAPRLTAAGGADYTIDAQGHALNIAAATAGSAALSAAQSAGRLALAADTVNIAGRIDLPAGQLIVDGTNGISVDSGALISATGVAQDFSGQTRYMPGGDITLRSTAGNIAVADAAIIDVSAASDGGDAGRLSLSAPHGAVQIDGTLRGQAADGYHTGSFTLDQSSIADFSAWNTLLNNSGFTNQIDLRARSGNVSIAASDVVQAHDLTLAVDQGTLDVAGTIDASGEDGGQISLSSSGTLSVLPGALLDAHATSALGNGGSVTLQTGDAGSLNVSGGTIDVSPGYTVDANDSVTAAGTAGHVHLRAPRVGNDVAITAFNTAITNSGKTFAYHGLDTPVGLVDVTAEAYRSYTASTIDSGLIDAITADNADYMTHQVAITDRLGMTGNPQFYLAPGVEVRSSGDLTLASTWDLSASDADYTGAVAGVLTLRAAGDLNINSALSDGFNGALPSSGFSTAPVSTWSYRLVGGADLSSPDPLVVQPDAGNVNIGNDQLVRTGNGRIDVAAGHDIVFGNRNSVLYTAGTLASSLPGFANPAGSNYASGGGDISLTAQHDVVGAITGQMISDWIYRQGQLNPNGTIKTNSAWWLSFKDFQQNVGALGGGNISVDAGNDVTNLSAVIPTTGRQPGQVFQQPDPSVPAEILGGGNLNVNAGRNIDSGIFYVGKGTGTLRAGGAMGSARTVQDSNAASSDNTPIYTVLATADGRFDVLARGDATLESVINPSVLPQSATQSVLFGSLYYTYSTDSAASVQSLSGDVTFDNNSAALAASFGNLPFVDTVTGVAKSAAAKRGADSSVLLVYPGSLTATAYQGDITSNNTLTLYPAPLGNLQFLAGGNISVDAVNLADADASLLPTPAMPAYQYTNKANDAQARLTTNLINNPAISSLIHALTPVHDQVGNPDLEPVRIVAGGNIQGAFYLAKSVQLQAGQDILNLTLQAQNLRSTDISSVVAGGNITYTLNRESNGALDPNTDTIEIGGPGALQVQAGGSIDLGASTGIRTTGNNYNAALPGNGSDITVAAGVTTAADYNGFIDRYLDPTGPASAYKYVAELTDYMKQQLGDPQLSDAAALSGFRALDEAHQQAFLLTVFYDELRITGRTGGGNYQRGFDAISTLFPGADHTGSLSLPFSQIKSLAGGNINLLVPGGLVNAGLANPPANLGALKAPADLGIVAQGTGSISAFTKGDFLVNQSRVFTLEGGNILIWSSDGNIDAGRGAKTAISAPPPLLTTDANGHTVFTFHGAAQGSGIRVILTSADVAPGDVDLIAPNGEVNAGDAGIGSAGNLNIAALRVVGADNIQVAGVSSGVPSESGGLSGGLAGMSNLTGDGGNVADSVTKSLGAGDGNGALAYLSVDVLGFGDCKSGDENCQ